MYLDMSTHWHPVALIVFWVALISLALFPFLFGERLFIDGDVTLYYYPAFEFYHQAIAQGSSFLWNPSIFLGLPMYLSQSAGFLDPLNWLLFHLPTFTAYHLRLAVDFLLVLALSYVAGRQFGLTRTAALLIGMGYLIAFNWRYLTNVVIANSLFLLPLLFYAGMRLFKATREWERWTWIVLMGAGVGWSFVAGYAQLTIYALFVFGIFYLYYFFFVLPSEKGLRSLVRWAGYGLSIVVLGFLFGLPQILPALEFTPLTVRSEGVAYEVATYKTTEPGDLVLFAFPDYLYFPYLSSGRKPLYIGILLFLLALVGIREALRSRKKEPVTIERHIFRALTIIFAFCFIASLQWSPVFYAMQKLPIFELFRFPYRWMYIGIWFLAVLGAYGFDKIYLRRDELKNAWLTRIVAGIGAIGVIGVLVLNTAGAWFWNGVGEVFNFAFSHTLYGHGPFTKDASHYEEAVMRGIDAWRGFLSLTEVKFLIPFLLIVFSGFLLYLVFWRNLSERKFRIATLGVSIATFLSVFMVQWPYSLPSSVARTHSELLSQTFTNEELLMYRTYPFSLGTSLSKSISPTYQLTQDQIMAIAEMQFATGWPNMHVYDGRESSVDGYDPFVPSDMVSVLGAIGSTHGGEEETKRLPEGEAKDRLLANLDVLGMLSGRFIISGVVLEDSALTLRSTWPVSHLGGRVYVYESAYALPRWYFARSVVAQHHESLTELLDTVDPKTFKRQTYLNCESCAGSRPLSAKDTVTLESNAPALRSFVTRTTDPQWLVFNESFLPGWEARIDGEEVEIVRANGIAMAVQVPSGEHRVTFEYVGVLQEAGFLKAVGAF